MIRCRLFLLLCLRVQFRRDIPYDLLQPRTMRLWRKHGKGWIRPCCMSTIEEVRRKCQYRDLADRGLGFVGGPTTEKKDELEDRNAQVRVPEIDPDAVQGVRNIPKQKLYTGASDSRFQQAKSRRRPRSTTPTPLDGKKEDVTMARERPTSSPQERSLNTPSTHQTTSSLASHLTGAGALSYPPSRSLMIEKNTSGTPFLRAPMRSERSPSPASGSVKNSNEEEDVGSRQEKAADHPTKGQFVPEDRSGFDAMPRSASAGSLPRPVLEKAYKPIQIPVGISRLHVVGLPDLEMKPIYWSP